MNKFKVGIDFHGVIDSSPEFFAALTGCLVKAGHEVHIITGPRVTAQLTDQLKELRISFTHIFSITDKHVEAGTPMTWDDKGNPHLDAYLWDKTKAEYCKEQDINLHLDDSDVYGYFFKTPYARFFSKDTKRIRKTHI